MEWISINWENVPLETQILVKHSGGIEGIHWFSGQWQFWYSGRACSVEFLESITHYIVI